MPRIRTTKPEFWTSAQVLECSPIARLLFLGLWNFCDDAGRHPNSAKQCKAEIFPSDDFTSHNILEMLLELSENGLIEFYTVDNEEYFYITGWHHQRIDKPQPAKYPPPPTKTEMHSANDPRTIPPDRKGKDRIVKEGIVGEGKGKERKKEKAASQHKKKEAAAASKIKDEKSDPIVELEPDDTPSVEEPDDTPSVEELERSLCQAARTDKLKNLDAIENLIDDGTSIENTILPALREVAAQGRKGNSWRYYLKPISEYHNRHNGRSNGSGEVVQDVAWIPTDHKLFPNLLDRANLVQDMDTHRELKPYNGTDGTPGRHFPKDWINEELEEQNAQA